jgi:hypothetical protein
LSRTLMTMTIIIRVISIVYGNVLDASLRIFID